MSTRFAFVLVAILLVAPVAHAQSGLPKWSNVVTDVEPIGPVQPGTTVEVHASGEVHCRTAADYRNAPALSATVDAPPGWLASVQVAYDDAPGDSPCLGGGLGVGAMRHPYTVLVSVGVPVNASDAAEFFVEVDGAGDGIQQASTDPFSFSFVVEPQLVVSPGETLAGEVLLEAPADQEASAGFTGLLAAIGAVLFARRR